jgi:hypothetical protein
VKVTIMVTDIYVRFRLAAIAYTYRPPQTWVQEVMTVVEVARILFSLGFLEAEAADRLAFASTTIVPQEGLDTIPLTDIVPLIELLHPEDDPPSLEIQDTCMLVANGETTEEALAAAGFILEVKGPLQ